MNCRRLLIQLGLLLLFLVSRQVRGGTWTALANTAPAGVNTMLLLSDGTVMAADSGNNWYRLTPDSTGSYVNGTWSLLAAMNYTRLYFSSQVLTNGQVLVAGAEYGTGTNSAEIYDPVANTWTTTPPPPAGQNLFYDSISEMLPNGNVLVAPVNPATFGGTVVYNTTSNVWSVGPSLYRGYYQDEASWVKLPDDSIVTIDPFGTNSERYIPSLNQWVNDANVPVDMYDPYGYELGAGFLLPDGRAFYLGATGNTVFYTPSGTNSPGSWSAGPVIPNSQATADAPAAMMVNGKVLCAVAPVPVNSSNIFNSPVSFYEFDPVTNGFAQVNGPTGLTYPSSTYTMRMLDLPDGSVLLSVSSSQLYDYTPGTAPLAAGQPNINAISTNLDGSYTLTGTLLNGISEGAAYGDDAQMNSNYPLIRMTNLTSGLVYYARTYGWNSTSVMTGSRAVSTRFTAPATAPAGNYNIVAVANGIASAPVAFSLQTAPVIASQPASETVTVGSTASFSITANGSAPLAYNWYRNGVLIAGATNTTYSTNNVQLADNGAQFSCVISNALGTATSANAVLTVTPANLVLNGGFETGDLTDWTQSGYTVATGVTSYYSFVHTGSFGLAAGPATILGYLAQTLNTVPNQVYHLSFWFNNQIAGSGPSSGSNYELLQASWDGTNVFAITNPPVLGWTSVSALVTASTASTVLQFGFRNDPYYFAVDDVSAFAVAPTIVQPPGYTNGVMQFSWATQAGLTYQVQYRTNLVLGAWVNLGSPTNTTGASITVTDAAASDAQRFYRLMVLP